MIKRSRENTELLHFHNIIYIRVSLSGTPDGLTQEQEITLQASRYKRLQSNGFITRWWMNYYYYFYYFLELLLAGLLLDAGSILFWLLPFF